MAKRNIILVFFMGVLSCTKVYYFPTADKQQPMLYPNAYTFDKKLALNDFKTIDTTALYVQIFDSEANDDERANPRILNFHNDGYFETHSKKTLGKPEFKRTKNAIYYGGKYFVEDTNIFIEAFYPTTGSKARSFTRKISKGTLYGDTISLNIFGSRTRYVRLPMSK